MIGDEKEKSVGLPEETVGSYRWNSMASTSSNLMMTVGLWMKMNDLASGYSRPSLALREQRTALVSRDDTKCLGTYTCL